VANGKSPLTDENDHITEYEQNSHLDSSSPGHLFFSVQIVDEGCANQSGNHYPIKNFLVAEFAQS
jgi:hypothetical protein